MFDELYFGNTLRTWAIAVGTALVSLIVLLLIKRIAVSRLSRLAARTTTDIDDLFVDLLKRTRPLFLLAMSLSIGAQTLTVTDQVQNALRIFTVLVLLLQGAIWGNGLIAFGITRTAQKRLTEDAAGATTLTALGFVSKLVLWSIVLLLALDNLGFDITALVAGLGVTGIAVALAVQSILGDLFSSLSIVLDKPFVIGDFIIVDTLMGTVEHVGLKTTRIRSLSGEQIVFSNTDLLRSRIRNFKRMQERRAVFTFGVTYQTPAEKLERIPAMVREIIGAQEMTRFDRAHFMSFGDSALTFEVVYFVLDPDYLRYANVQQAINLALVRRFESEQIEFAYPTRTLYVKQ